MARRVEVSLVDDTDGTAAEETVRFALDGVSYEIDLNRRNAAKLRESIDVWVAAAKRSGGRRTTSHRTGASRPAAERRDLSAVRAWARQNGFEVSDRGRIAAEVQAAYEKANA